MIDCLFPSIVQAHPLRASEYIGKHQSHYCCRIFPIHVHSPHDALFHTRFPENSIIYCIDYISDLKAKTNKKNKVYGPHHSPEFKSINTSAQNNDYTKIQIRRERHIISFLRIERSLFVKT